MPHFGGQDSTFITIPDPGMTIRLGGLELQAIPAHYLHSSGNFHLYDPKAKILFSWLSKSSSQSIPILTYRIYSTCKLSSR